MVFGWNRVHKTFLTTWQTSSHLISTLYYLFQSSFVFPFISHEAATDSYDAVIHWSVHISDLIDIIFTVNNPYYIGERYFLIRTSKSCQLITIFLQTPRVTVQTILYPMTIDVDLPADHLFKYIQKIVSYYRLVSYVHAWGQRALEIVDLTTIFQTYWEENKWKCKVDDISCIVLVVIIETVVSSFSTWFVVKVEDQRNVALKLSMAMLQANNVFS